MKKIIYFFCYLVILYLIFHVTVFAMNNDYRHRFEDESYMRGECTKSFYVY